MKNKLVLFVLALVLLVGIIMVCLLGFNVSLDLRAHDTLKFVFDQKFQMDDITKICDEVFENKEYEVKTVEVFSDAVYIISPTITTDEEEALLEKLDGLYKNTEENVVAEDTNTETLENSEEANVENENTDEDTNNQEVSILEKLEEGSKYKLYHDSKVRIRDIVKPYIIPSVICSLICMVYIGFKYRKLGNPVVTVCKTVGEMLLILLEILSIMVITRIPFTRAVIPIVMFILVVCLCIILSLYERKLENSDN